MLGKPFWERFDQCDACSFRLGNLLPSTRRGDDARRRQIASRGIIDRCDHESACRINGPALTAPSSASTITVLNSATEEPFITVAEAKEADVERAVAAARKAFDHGPWPRMSPAERAIYLRAFAGAMDKLAERGATIWSIESGLVHSTALAVCKTLGDFYRYYAGLADTFPFQERHTPQAPGNIALLVHEPVGVVGAIIPWNGPPNLAAVKLAPALLAGCTVILKASPEAPGAAYLIAEAAENAGLPPGVVNILTADRAVSESLVRHPGVDKVAFTGSTAAGRRIASICGERVARCTLELGGKSAALILDDYDIQTAAKTIAGRATFLTGQVCSSLTRIIVPRHRHDAMVEALSAEFRAVKVGDPFDAACGMGPLASSRQRERVEGYIAKGKNEGATLVTGGGRPAHLCRGFFVEPTVFGNVDNRSTIAREEIFGPVLSVIPADSEAHAVEVANDSIYGLGGAVFTNDVERAYAVARQLRTGTVAHNSHRTEMLIGYGGFKQSGIGREGGVVGLRAYLEPKTIILNSMPTAAGRVGGQSHV
ncbi:MAG TPA: aldehyde dehydrogenase [Burkholderiaceae bacterium]|nr:aldehyde dehydrogenase [Burkholderiaceae bacterium]